MPLPRWAQEWPILPILAVAALLRLADLGPEASAFYGDGAEYTSVARSLAADPLDLSYPDVERIGPEPFVSQPPVVLYLFAAAIRLTGSFETGPLLVSALLGTATVGVAYAFARLARDRWTGAAAALVLAVMPFHVRASREAQLDASLAFFLAATALAALAWHRKPTVGRAALLGTCAALATFSKLTGAAALALVVVPFAAAWLASRRGTRALPPRMGLHALAATAPLAALTALYTLLLWHLQATSNLLAKLSWQAGRVAGEGTVARPWHWYFTEPDVGLASQLGVLVLVLAAAGAAAALVEGVRRRQGRAEVALLLAWLLPTLLFLVASARKEWFYAVPLHPALAVLAAWPLAYVLPKSSPVARTAPARRWGVPVAAALLVVALAGPVQATAAGPGGFGRGVREAALWIHAEDPDAAQAGTTLGRFTLHLYNGQPTYHVWMNHTFVEREAEAGRLRFVVIDRYAPAEGEVEWLEGLSARHGGVVAWESWSEGVPVQVHRLHGA
jgi:4-amino-4-deoxy-L-arabinose transferase-like glycosyltransferase